MTKVYVTGNESDRDTIIKPLLERLRTAGCEITYDWTVGEQLNLSCASGLQEGQEAIVEACRRGIETADVFWLASSGLSCCSKAYLELVHVIELQHTSKAGYRPAVIVSGAKLQTDKVDINFDTHEEAFSWVTSIKEPGNS